MTAAAGGWQTLSCTDGNVHVVPVDDLRPHMQHGCWCCPTPAVDEEAVVVHHSMDRREDYEDPSSLH